MGRNVRRVVGIILISAAAAALAGCREALAQVRGAASPPATTASDAGAPVGPAQHAVEIAVRGNHACARMEDATVRCWGSPEQSSLGWSPSDDTTRPRVVEGLAGVAQLALGTTHNCARMADR